jgi:hypothetical protein
VIKTFYLILSNLRFRTISRVEFERRTIAKIRFDWSNKNFCSTLKLNRVELFDMFEIQLCDQLNEDDVIRFRWESKNFDREISQLKTAQKCFKEEIHDRIDESLNNVRFSYWYEDYQFYENV